MRFDELEIVEACRDLWKTSLGLSLERPQQPADTNEPIYASRVDLSGTWDGSIVLECPQSVGRHAAAMLFSVDTDTLDDDELQAAVDELVRLIGKNLTRRFDDPGKLSQPQRHEPAEDRIEDGLRGLTNLDLECEGRPCRLRIFEAAGEVVTTG